jgi:hypothetical protein
MAGSRPAQTHRSTWSVKYLATICSLLTFVCSAEKQASVLPTRSQGCAGYL